VEENSHENSLDNFMPSFFTFFLYIMPNSLAATSCYCAGYVSRFSMQSSIHVSLPASITCRCFCN